MESVAKTKMGCDQCWPASADDAWAARANLDRSRQLFDDSHFRVMVLGCKACGQRFLSVFTELSDYVNGDDSQGWVLVPITDDEEQGLASAGTAEFARQVYATGKERWSLLKIHACGHPANVFWGVGIPMLPHG